MTTIVEGGGDSGAGILALAIIVAAVVFALFAFGAFDGGPITVPAPGGNTTTIHVNPATPAPSTPVRRARSLPE